MSRLQNLYRDLVEREYRYKSWHDSYKKFCDKVKAMRQHIANGQGLNKNDEAFLKKLLYDKSNGVADKGQSNFSWDNFQAFIRNEDFLSTLSEFIVCPKKELFEKFENAWKAQGVGNNPVLVNRVAAACTREVSTTVDKPKFDQVFNWLIREGIISSYPSHQDQGLVCKKSIFAFRI